MREHTSLITTVRIVVSAVLGLVLTVYYADSLMKWVARLHLVKEVDAQTKGFREKLSTWWTTDLMFGLIAVAIIATTRNWLDPYFLVFATLTIVMPILYWALNELTDADVLFTSGETETFALIVNKGALRKIILYSEKFRPSEEKGNWDFVRGKEPMGILEEELNARWKGLWWNRQFYPVMLRCHRWKEDKDGKRIQNGTEPKPDHYFKDYVRLYHTHAYISDEIETPGLIHVMGAFNFRFRITNPHKAFFMTKDVVDMLNTIARGVTRQVWAITKYEDIRVSKFETAEESDEDNLEKLSNTEDGTLRMGYQLMYLMNAELKKYGIKIIDIHLVDILNTRQEEMVALRAKEINRLLGDANIEAANKAKEVKLINAEAEAKAITIVGTAEARVETKKAGAMYRANKGKAGAMMAYAVRHRDGLKALGSSSLLIDGKEEEPPKTTPKKK